MVGKRFDYVYVRESPAIRHEPPCVYVGKSNAQGGNRALAFKPQELRRRWPEVFRMQLPIPCQEDLAVTEAVVLDYFLEGGYVQSNEDSRISSPRGILLNSQTLDVTPIRKGYPLRWLGRYLVVPPKGRPEPHYMFCHKKNRDAVLRMLMQGNGIQDFLPVGQLSDSQPTTVKALSGLLNASLIVFVNVNFRDTTDGRVNRGDLAGFLKRVRKYWRRPGGKTGRAKNMYGGYPPHACPEVIVAMTRIGGSKVFLGAWAVKGWTIHSDGLVSFKIRRQKQVAKNSVNLIQPGKRLALHRGVNKWLHDYMSGQDGNRAAYVRT